MKTLLLNDETRPTNLMLENNAITKVILRRTIAVAGCNCDRWGHPCSDCDEHKVEAKTQLPLSASAKQTS